MADDEIPIVDLGKFGLNSTGEPSSNELESISSQIVNALSTIGFVYLKNHGIPEATIQDIFTSSRHFFTLDSDTKSKYNRGITQIQGYTSPNRETFTTDEKLKELRESYDITRLDGKFPDMEVPSFRPNVNSLGQQCIELSKQLFKLMAVGLGKDRSFFVDKHQRLFGEGNSSSIRVLYYPPIPEGSEGERIRIAQHTDYGSFTLLFQDSLGGLEVLNLEGQWIKANPIPGALLVNIGDLTQFWTNNRLRATEHRVLVPKDEIKRRIPRQSVVCFVHPDEEVVIEPLFGSAPGYIPITAKEHADKRFINSYRY